MAEFVQLRLEEMRPELEQYSKFELFGAGDIRKITIQRKELEYKIHKHSKSKDDYLKYIQYEVNLLKLLRLKLEHYKIEENGIKVKKELARFVVNRVMSLFFYAVSRFPEDIKLWLSFIKFCKTERKFTEVSKNLERMLKYHGNKEEMWKIAAHWEYMECRNIETARGFLLTGMRHHPNSEFIYSEAIWLELKYADHLRRVAIKVARKNNAEPDLNANVIMKGGLAQVMYETALEKITSCQFLCTVLKIALDFEYPTDLQKSIKKNLTENHADDPQTWIALAQLELEGFTFEGEMSTSQLYKRKSSCNKLAPSKKQILYANELLNNAAHNINTEEVWTQYINVLLDILENSESGVKSYPNLVRRLLKEALEAAHIQAKLAAQLYRHYIELIGSDVKEIEEVLIMATDRHPKALELWMAQLKLSFAKSSKAKSQKIFQLAIKEFKDSDEVLQLWIVMTEHFSKDEGLLDSLFKLALPVKSNATEKIQIMHLDHVFNTKGLNACRSLYNKMSITPPLSLQLHSRMIEIELQQAKVDAKQTRKCFELACNQFGSKDSGIWMDYVNFELTHGSKPLITGIYTRATKTLESAESENFTLKYCKLQTSIS